MNEEIKDRDEIYLPKIIGKYEKNIGFIIELERAICHIESFKKILSKCAPTTKDKRDESISWIENDSSITILLNIMASQLREAIHLFHRFQRTKLWDDWSKWVERESNSEKNAILTINLILNEFNKEEDGFLRSILIPLRNATFHYKEIEAKKWFDEKVKDFEGDIKPQREFVKFVNKDTPSFYLGEDYDGWLNSNYLILNQGKKIEGLFDNLLKLQRLQDSFLELKYSIAKFLIKKSE